MQREEGEKNVVLSLSAKPTAASSSTIPSGGLELNPPKLTANPLKPNPLKRPNPLKQASASSSAAEKSNGRERKETFLFNCGEAHPGGTGVGRPYRRTGLWIAVRFDLCAAQYLLRLVRGISGPSVVLGNMDVFPAFPFGIGLRIRRRVVGCPLER